MATNISGLFGDITKTPQQYQQEALQGLIVTPAQMGQQGLYQQLVSQMSNAGANIGMGVGGLLGGKTAEQVRDSQINAAMQEVSQGQYATEWEKLDALAKKLAEKGLNAEAEKAADRSIALKPKDDSASLLKDFTAESVANYRKTGNFGDLVRYNSKTTTSPSVGANAELIAQSKFNKPFSELTIEQKKAVYSEAKKESSLGTGLSNLASAIAKKYGEQSGKDVAESVAPKVIQGKQDTISALERARKLLDNGIYTGGLADLKMGMAKYTPLGSQEKLENTEKYIAYVSTTVIPLLQEFGGNDSNEELKFLKRLVGGEITLEEDTLKEIVDSAILKVRSSVKRAEANVEAVQKGQPLDTQVVPQKFGGQSKTLDVGATTNVNGVAIKRVK